MEIKSVVRRGRSGVRDRLPNRDGLDGYFEDWKASGGGEGGVNGENEGKWEAVMLIVSERETGGKEDAWFTY